MNNNPYEVPPETQPSTPEEEKPRSIVLPVLAGIVIAALLVGLFTPAVRTARPAAYRMQCSNNLKQIALALANYELRYRSFPPAVTVDPAGHPLHSWRTLLLPFLEQQALYDSIDLSKPWNDPANAAAYATSLAVYHCPSIDPSTSPGSTTYLGVVGQQSFFPLVGSRLLYEITDSSSRTLTVVEVPTSQAVHWMQPSDTNESRILSMIGSDRHAHSAGFNGAFVDGGVGFLGEDTSREELQAFISVAGDKGASEASTF